MEVLQVASALGAARSGLVLRRELVARCGRGAVSRAVRCGALHEVATGVLALAPLPARHQHVVTPVGPDHAYLLQAAAALVSLGPRAAARARTAAVLLGVDLLVEPDQVEVVWPYGGLPAPRRGVDVRASRRRPACVGVTWPGLHRLRVTSALETVAAMAAERGRREAVAVLDGLLRRGRLTEEEVEASARDGVLANRAGRAAAAVRDVRAGSVLESAARVALVEAGLTGFETQYVLPGRRGVPRTVVDFAWPAERVVLEVDGARYHEAEQDRKRDNGSARQHWYVLRAGWAEVMSGAFLVEVADTLGRQLPA